MKPSSINCSDCLPFVYDVIIVGAGPCGLAVAARLQENTPSALFTDEEHDRYHWINRHASRAAIKHSKTGAVHGTDNCGRAIGSPSMLVLDSSGKDWMVKWNRLFAGLNISHLRSPMFFHPDPHDRDGLLAFVHSKSRECDCLEITGCVGKEISKHQAKKRRRQRQKVQKPPTTIDERDRKDYFAPPSDLFQAYCSDIAQRYNICGSKVIQQTVVDDIDYVEVPHISTDEKLFVVRTSNGTFYARSTVLAVGSGNRPSAPEPFRDSDCPCACHVFQNSNATVGMNGSEAFPPNVLVIGGGLTSAQIVDRAICNGAEKVWLLMRGPLKIKPFDVDLSWMGKFKNHEKALFWSADSDEERVELIKSARGGGSITPRFWKILEQHVASGRLQIYTSTRVISQEYHAEDKTMSIQTAPSIENLPRFHRVLFATGVQSDFQKLQCLQTMINKYPIRAYDGLPALTDDLMWTKDVPLFVTGKLAALQLGPGAGNLEGARTGAERIAWALGEISSQFAGQDSQCKGSLLNKPDGTREVSSQYRYLSGVGSRFESLSIDE